MKRIKAWHAWTCLLVGVIGYEVGASDGELLSHGVDKALDKHPVVTWLAIGLTAAHLLNLLDHPPLSWVDPYKHLARIASPKNLP